MSTHAITLAPYLESFDSDTTADNAIINDVTSILEDVIPIMEHPSENFLSDVSFVFTRIWILVNFTAFT